MESAWSLAVKIMGVNECAITMSEGEKLIEADRASVLHDAVERMRRQLRLCASNTNFEDSVEWLDDELTYAIINDKE